MNAQDLQNQLDTLGIDQIDTLNQFSLNELEIVSAAPGHGTTALLDELKEKLSDEIKASPLNELKQQAEGPLFEQTKLDPSAPEFKGPGL